MEAVLQAITVEAVLVVRSPRSQRMSIHPPHEDFRIDGGIEKIRLLLVQQLEASLENCRMSSKLLREDCMFCSSEGKCEQGFSYIGIRP